MLEHGFVQEDVLIKMFKFYLEEHAHEWYQSLPAVNIHSLKDFHVAFNSYYKKIYLSDLIFDNCCKEFEFHIQQTIECSSCDESGEDLIERESEDISEYFVNMDEKVSLYISREEGLLDMNYDSVDDSIAINSLYFSPRAPDVSYLK
jgi:hypothetical protein